MSFDGTNLALTGAVNATSGNIGGWVINGNVLQSSNAATILNPNGDIDLAGQLDASGNINTGANMSISGTVTANTSVNVLGNQGIYYPTVAGSMSVASKGISFYWNGTNLYARLYNRANATYQDVCLTNCGSGSPAPDPAPTTVVGPAPTTVVGTVVVGTVVGTVVVGTVVGTVVVGSPPAACDPPCPDGFFCIDNSYCIG